MRRRRRGQLHLSLSAVSTPRATPGSRCRARCLAAVKACGPGAALSHFSAAALWSLLHWDEDWLPDVTVPSEARGARSLASTSTAPAGPSRSSASTASPSRPLPERSIDLSSVLPFKPLRRAVREAMALKRVTVKELARREAQTLDQILADGYVPTRNRARGRRPRPHHERRLRTARRQQAIIGGGLPRRPTSAGPSSASSSKPTAGSGTTTRSPARTTPSARRASKPHGERVIRVTWKQAIVQPDDRRSRRIRSGRCAPSAVDVHDPSVPLPAGHVGKFVVLIVVVALLRRPRQPVRQVREASRRTSPRRGCPADAESVKALEAVQQLPGRRARAGGDRLRAPGRPDRRRQAADRRDPHEAQREPCAELVLEAQEPVSRANGDGRADRAAGPARRGVGGHVRGRRSQSIRDRAGESGATGSRSSSPAPRATASTRSRSSAASTARCCCAAAAIVLVLLIVDLPLADLLGDPVLRGRCSPRAPRAAPATCWPRRA